MTVVYAVHHSEGVVVLFQRSPSLAHAVLNGDTKGR